MHTYASKQDMMTDNAAFYKTEKAVNVYRKEIFQFDTLWQSQQNKAWVLINTASQKIVKQYSKLIYVMIIALLVALFVVMYNMPGVREGIREYRQMSEFAKHTTGRFGRIFQIVKHFGLQEYFAMGVFTVIMAIVSTYYGKWMIKKVTQEIKSSI